MYILKLIGEFPGMTAALAVAIMSVCGASFLLARRRRRLRELHRSKARARHLLMEARRSASLRTGDDAKRAPLLVRMVKLIADRAGFHLHDIGTSERQLDKLLMTAKEKINGRSNGPNPRPNAAASRADKRPDCGVRAPFIELLPDNGGVMVLTAPSGDEIGIGPAQADRTGFGLEADREPPDRVEEIVVEIDDSAWPPGTGTAAAREKFGGGERIQWFTLEDLVQGGEPADLFPDGGTLALVGEDGPGPERDEDVNVMFDRIIMDDEEAGKNPAQAIVIRVDGKKFGM